jgi:hypothetical protein
MMWCIAWIEMLPGMRGWMILVDCRGGVGTWVVGGSGRSVSGLMTVYWGGVAIEIGRARLQRPGRMSWMVTAEVFLSGPSVGIGINGGLACRKTPGRCIGGRGNGMGLAVGRRGSSRSGRGAFGLHLLCTTVSSSSLSSSVSARIWKGLLLRVTL